MTDRMGETHWPDWRAGRQAKGKAGWNRSTVGWDGGRVGGQEMSLVVWRWAIPFVRGATVASGSGGGSGG